MASYSAQFSKLIWTYEYNLYHHISTILEAESNHDDEIMYASHA